MLSGMSRFILLLILSNFAHGHMFATYNLRNDNSGDAKAGNAWKNRAPVIANMVRFHGLDLFGAQEGLNHQMSDLKKLLPDHELITHGRDDGKEKGEHAGIFYRHDKFALLESGCFWLSGTPEKTSVGWDAALPRICTWAKFEDRADKKSFYVLNVHFDHRGQQARLESAKLLHQKALEIASKSPVIILGDFNANQNSEVHKILADKKNFHDAFDLAPIKLATTGTSNSFDPHTNSNSRIDHIYLSPQFKVEKFGILTDSYRRKSRFGKSQAALPSDHFPVVVEAHLSEK